MSKEEIIKNIIRKIQEEHLGQIEIDSYIKGYLDALCYIYGITRKQREEIEKQL